MKELCVEIYDEGVLLVCMDVVFDDCCDDGVCNNLFDSCMGCIGFMLLLLLCFIISDVLVSI